MQPRLLEQAAAPALPRDDVAVERGHVGRERKVEDRADVGEQLVAAVGAGGDDRVGVPGGERPRPGGRLVGAAERDRPNRRRASGRSRAPAPRARRPARRSRRRSRDAELLQQLDDARGGAGALAEELRLLALSLGDEQPQLLELRGRPESPAVRASGFCFARNLPGTDG